MENTYNINGTEYWIDEFDAGWLWQSKEAEGDIYHPTALEALQSSMQHASQREDEMSIEDQIANAADFKNDMKREDSL